MNKRTKGALAMVLAGSVTFSVINALLDDQPSKRIAKEIALTISGIQKKADVINQAEKTAKDQTPTTNVKDVETKLSHNISAFQADIQQNKGKLTKRTTTNSANTDTTTTKTPAATTLIATSIKAPKTTAIPAATGTNTPSEATTTIPVMTGTDTTGKSTTTIPTTTGTSATNQTTTTTTTTNHGQQVSQAQKEKAASHQDKRGNNGKKFNSL
jgi:hypothetical protein